MRNMKINYDFYSGKDEYSDGEIEKEILQYEEKYKEEEFNEIFKKDVRWPIFYHLTHIRKNIINWYPFKENSKVLEIGAGMGAITGALCEKAAQVTSVELSKQRATSIANRCRDKENLEIIVGNFNDIEFKEQYDYITLIGVFEYAQIYIGTPNSFNDFLDKIKKLLKKDGKLLIAIENQFGMKYYAGAKEDHTGIKYDSISGYKYKDSARTFGKKELTEILKKSGLEFTKFYYPLPDYKLPTKIFSEDYLPNEKTIEDYTPYYIEKMDLNFDEKTAYKEVIRNNMFEFFANSFFVECSEHPIDTSVNVEKIELNQITEEEMNFYNNVKIEKENKIEQKDDSIEDENQIKIEQNLLNWYKFKEEASFLQIGSELEGITQLLQDKASKLVTIEKQEKLEEKFDYVILYNPNLLQYAQEYVKEDGTILLATNNRFAISYLAGGSYNGEIYKTLENEKSNLYSKQEIIDLLKKSGLENYKFYYPLPNYKMPNVIFSDDYIPNENTTKLMYNIMYEKESIVVFDELKVLKQLTKNGLFDIFTNSFLIEINMKQDANRENAKFISYNNNRKEEYQLATIMYKDRVEKRIINEKAQKHIKNIELNTKNLEKLGFNMIDQIKGNCIVSKYIDEDTFDKIIVKQLLLGNIGEACSLIEKWYAYIKERLIKNKKSKLNENISANEQDLEGLTILKNGYIDLVFENTFYNENKFIFFDQEWYMDGVPIEFLLYRAINNLYVYNGEIEKIINIESIFEKFNLTKHILLFKKIEKYIQNIIIDEQRQKINQQSLNKLTDINNISVLVNQIKDFEANDIEQDEYIKGLEEDNKNKQIHIENIERINRELQNKIKEIEESKQSKKLGIFRRRN